MAYQTYAQRVRSTNFESTLEGKGLSPRTIAIGMNETQKDDHRIQCNVCGFEELERRVSCRPSASDLSFVVPQELMLPPDTKFSALGPTLGRG